MLAPSVSCLGNSPHGGFNVVVDNLKIGKKLCICVRRVLLIMALLHSRLSLYVSLAHFSLDNTHIVFCLNGSGEILLNQRRWPHSHPQPPQSCQFLERAQRTSARDLDTITLPHSALTT